MTKSTNFKDKTSDLNELLNNVANLINLELHYLNERGHDDDLEHQLLAYRLKQYLKRQNIAPKQIKLTTRFVEQMLNLD
ncbi:hypothetical protein [uncultured Shewanella sp.]|uniref:hypothetical protein n=1 Tax=uncultured Shewanella sp. TaxID=173975 RepID=UPI002625184F|nr:hypothetical protein [uncultured Shewanella sp.]